MAGEYPSGRTTLLTHDCKRSCRVRAGGPRLWVCFGMNGIRLVCERRSVLASASKILLTLKAALDLASIVSPV